MAELIDVTDEDRAEIIINLDFVVQIQPSERAKISTITIADGTTKYAIYVHGSPKRIAATPCINEETRLFGD